MVTRGGEYEEGELDKGSQEAQTASYEYLRYNVGEGSGNPLQYSCLENPMDGGAWRAAVYGVAKSRT